MRRLSCAVLALTTALAAVPLAGTAQARDRGDGPRYSEGHRDRGHFHRHHGHGGPNVFLGLGDGYYDNGIWIGVGDPRYRRHHHHRHYD